MPLLPRLRGKEAIKVFEQFGWKVVRHRGSHIIMVKEGHISTLSIPDHKEVAQGTLRSLIRAADLSVAEFAKVSKEV